MKALLLTTSGQLQDNGLRDRLLAEACELTAVHLTGRQQKRLWWHLRGLDFARYDAVLANLQIKRFRRQLRFMRRIPNLFCYELDACQNYIPSSKWHGAYAEFFGRRLPSATVLCTGFNVARKLAALAKDPGKQAKIQQAGMAHAREHLSYAAQAKAILSCMAAQLGSRQ